jgi:spoIIIJ-associated protein
MSDVTDDNSVEPTAGGGSRGRDEQQATPDEIERHCREAESALRRLLELMGLDCQAELSGCEEGRGQIEITGPDVALVIGKHGQTIDALQFLSGLIASRALGGWVPINLDAAGYRDRRAAALTQMAKEVAAQVKEKGEEAVLDVLRPHERRIVHLALRDEEGIVTYSEGEEPFRRVVISPAD